MLTEHTRNERRLYMFRENLTHQRPALRTFHGFVIYLTGIWLNVTSSVEYFISMTPDREKVLIKAINLGKRTPRRLYDFALRLDVRESVHRRGI